MRESTKENIFLFSSFVLICIIGIIYYFVDLNNNAIKNEIIEGDTISVKLEEPDFFLYDEPTIELVMDACIYYDIKFPEIVTAQSILETGNYRSEICKNKNNLFGLYNSRKKEYYSFEHWTESVKAYHNLIQYRYKDGDYYEWLDKIGYAEDSIYVIKVKEVVQRYNLVK